MNSFDYSAFIQYLSKILSIGIYSKSADTEEFSKYRNLLISETANDDPPAARAFSIILSGDYINSTHKDTLFLLNSFLANYKTTFVNSHQYTEPTVNTNIRIAKSFADELSKNCPEQTSACITSIMNWFDIIVERFVNPVLKNR